MSNGLKPVATIFVEPMALEFSDDAGVVYRVYPGYKLGLTENKILSEGHIFNITSLQGANLNGS
jgi:hypothetical protein